MSLSECVPRDESPARCGGEEGGGHVCVRVWHTLVLMTHLNSAAGH